MKAVIWNAPHDVRVERVRDPQIVNPRDAIIRVTATAICGSDLHLYNGLMPTMKPGDVLGHEVMGIVEEVGPAVDTLRPGDRVVVPFAIACGNCEPCLREQWSLCDNSNPNAGMAERLYGYSCSGLFGYSHLFGGYSGGQAEYVRVPFADVGPLPVPDELEDERLLYLTDIFPTGYMAAENCDVKSGDVVAVWGCGPVGQFAIRSAFLLGAERVVAIDRIPERLEMARRMVVSYAIVPFYGRLFARQGFGEEVQAVQTCWRSGDRAGAPGQVSTAMLQEVVSVGGADAHREKVEAYWRAGLGTPVLWFHSPDGSPDKLRQMMAEVASAG